MGVVFLKVINMSIAASWLILAVILVRLFLKKAPKWISCVLWALVAVRFVCPFSPESALSLIPSSETIPSNIEMMQNPSVDFGITLINKTINPVIAHRFTPDPTTSANPLQIVVPVLSVVWIAGMTAMLLYALISYIRLKKRVGASAPIRDNIFACDEVNSPFILGIVNPLIYIPSSMTEPTLDYVITHETAHIRRRDHWWKPFGFLLLAVYWFNPLCWLAYILFCRDIEMACDEKVIRGLGSNNKAEYSQALLDCSFPRRRIVACPLAFGEVGVKERVKSVLNYKKPSFWIITVALAACVAVGICFGTNPTDTVLTKWNIDEVNMNKTLDDVHSFSVRYRNNEVACNDTETSRFLATMDKIKIGRIPISKSRDENRSAVFTVTINKSLKLHFNEKLNELWVDNGVKPSYTYKITNPSTAEELLIDFNFTTGELNGPGGVIVNIRTDVCALYLEVLEDLWNVDPGLNDGISQIGMDLSELSHLNEAEKDTVIREFAAKHDLPYLVGTWEELCEQGYIDKDNLYWEDGLFFSIKTNEDAVWNLPAIKEGDSVPELTAFDAQKWRSGSGAYFFGQCTAQKNADGKWSYTVGQEAIS